MPSMKEEGTSPHGTNHPLVHDIDTLSDGVIVATRQDLSVKVCLYFLPPARTILTHQRRICLPTLPLCILGVSLVPPVMHLQSPALRGSIPRSATPGIGVSYPCARSRQEVFSTPVAPPPRRETFNHVEVRVLGLNMHDEPHRSTRGSERMIETVYEPAFYRPDVRSITVRVTAIINDDQCPR